MRLREALAWKWRENKQAKEPTRTEWNCGRGDLGGAQTFGPEHNGMTAASKNEPVLKVVARNLAVRQSGHNMGKTEVLWEETGKGTTRADGIGVQARGERYAEIMSGKPFSQQGLTITCKDLLTKM